MNYTSFCEYLLAALTNQMDSSASITKESIRKNNNVSLDALVIRIPNVSCAPVIYLQPLYQAYMSGSPIDRIAQTILAKLKHEMPLSLELADRIHSFHAIRDRIVYRLISQKDNQDFLSDIPWIPYLDLAIIFYLHLGTADQQQITTVIHNRQAESWNISPLQLYELAKENTPKLYPGRIGRMDHILFDLEEDDDFSSADDPFPQLYILSNRTGIHGAICMLYDNIIKDFANRIGSDLIILPSSIHEVLIVPDSHDQEYEIFRQMVRNVNAEDVLKEEILSDEIYLYRRDHASIMKWTPCDSDNAETGGTGNL